MNISSQITTEEKIYPSYWLDYREARIPKEDVECKVGRRKRDTRDSKNYRARGDSLVE